MNSLTGSGLYAIRGGRLHPDPQKLPLIWQSMASRLGKQLKFSATLLP